MIFWNQLEFPIILSLFLAWARKETFELHQLNQSFNDPYIDWFIF